MKIELDKLELYDTEWLSDINEEYEMTIVDDAGDYLESCIVVNVEVSNGTKFEIVEILDSNDNEVEVLGDNLKALENKLNEIVQAEVEAIHEGKYSTRGAW